MSAIIRGKCLIRITPPSGVRYRQGASRSPDSISRGESDAVEIEGHRTGPSYAFLYDDSWMNDEANQDTIRRHVRSQAARCKVSDAEDFSQSGMRQAVCAPLPSLSSRSSRTLF
jgi:hypothetical protein